MMFIFLILTCLVLPGVVVIVGFGLGFSACNFSYQSKEYKLLDKWAMRLIIGAMIWFAAGAPIIIVWETCHTEIEANQYTKVGEYAEQYPELGYYISVVTEDQMVSKAEFRKLENEITNIKDGRTKHEVLKNLGVKK